MYLWSIFVIMVINKLDLKLTYLASDMLSQNLCPDMLHTGFEWGGACLYHFGVEQEIGLVLWPGGFEWGGACLYHFGVEQEIGLVLWPGGFEWGGACLYHFGVEQEIGLVLWTGYDKICKNTC